MIPAIQAYYFLSMLKEFVEPARKFDITKYNEFKICTEDIFRNAYVKYDILNPSLSTVVNRLLYYLFEKARSADSIQKAKLDQDPLSRPILDNKGELLYQFGAYDTDLDILLEDYFPNKDIQQEPIINGGDQAKLLLFRRVGLSLMTIGRLRDADLIYSKSYSIAITSLRWSIDAAKILQLKSELYIHMGQLMDSIDAANSAISIYMQIHSDVDYYSTGQELWGVQNIYMNPLHLIICSLSYQAWVLHLASCSDFADIVFKEAEKLVQKIKTNPDYRPTNKYHPKRPKPMQHLRDLWGIYHADCLLRNNDEESIELAKLITLENLEYAECNGLTEIISQCNRVLGDIELKKKSETALYYYERAKEFAEKTSHHAVLIEAYAGLGRYYIHQKKYWKAIEELLFAYRKLPHTKKYKVYEADVEIALSIAYSKRNNDGDLEKFKQYANSALETAMEIHYGRIEHEAKDLLKTRSNRKTR